PASGAAAGRNLRLVAPEPGEDLAGPAGPVAANAGPETAAPDAKVRRIGRATPDAPPLYLCTGSRLVLQDGAPVPLTRREYDLFLFLCEHPRRVFSRAQLLRQ